MKKQKKIRPMRHQGYLGSSEEVTVEQNPVTLTVDLHKFIRVLKQQKKYKASKLKLRLTADKRLCYTSPRLPLATSFIRKTLYGNTKETRIFINTKKFPALKFSAF